jgi:tRNA pseudouridine38-40 synthase
MRTVRLLVSYNGLYFYGWQRQDGFMTVQQALEEGAAALLNECVVVQGAGRTDGGVHALRQVAHVQLETDLDDVTLRHAWNAHLVEGVVIRRIETCDPDFHARFDARGKRYLYRVQTARFRPPIGDGYAHWLRAPLDLGAMREAAAQLVGRHDFAAFGNTGRYATYRGRSGEPPPIAHSTVRTISGVRILARREGLGIFVGGDGFLYNMVRTIAGTLLEVGRGQMEVSSIGRALSSGKREDAGPTAPPGGLYLLRVLYSEPIFEGPDPSPVGGPDLTPGAFPG